MCLPLARPGWPAAARAECPGGRRCRAAGLARPGRRRPGSRRVRRGRAGRRGRRPARRRPRRGTRRGSSPRRRVPGGPRPGGAGGGLGCGGFLPGQPRRFPRPGRRRRGPVPVGLGRDYPGCSLVPRLPDGAFRSASAAVIRAAASSRACRTAASRSASACARACPAWSARCSAAASRAPFPGRGVGLRAPLAFLGGPLLGGGGPGLGGGGALLGGGAGLRLGLGGGRVGQGRDGVAELPGHPLDPVGFGAQQA